jgi:hypothetical protein
MPNITHPGTPSRTTEQAADPVMAPVQAEAPLPVPSWRTVAPSATTATSPPSLVPALDPVNAGVTVRVEWAGRCRGCRAPIWASVTPGKTLPRLCPGCRETERAAGRDVGAPIFRPWMVWRQRPPEGPGTRQRPPEGPGTSRNRSPKGGIAGCNGRALSDPHLEREFDTGFSGARTPRVGAHRGGRPALPPAERLSRRRATWRAYRARRKASG